MQQYIGTKIVEAFQIDDIVESRADHKRANREADGGKKY